MKKLLVILLLGCLWSSSRYDQPVVQDLIVETKIIKSLDVAKHLQPLDPNDKTYDLVISKANVGLEDVKKLQTQLLK